MDVDKRQGIVYHGKRDGISPRMVYHGKSINDAKSNRDSSNNIKASKLEVIRKQLDFGIRGESGGVSTSNGEQKFLAQYDQQSKRNVNNINGARMKELADLYEKLKKRTSEESEVSNVQKSFQSVKHTDKEQERSMNIGRVKKALVSLFDIISKSEGVVSGGNRKDSLHRDNSGYVAERRDFDSDIPADEIKRNRHVAEDQYQKKRRLLSMVRSLEAQLSKQDNRGLPDPSNQNGNVVSNKIPGRFESGLDGFESGRHSIHSDNKYANNAFADAIKGFAVQSKASGTKSAR